MTGGLELTAEAAVAVAGQAVAVGVAGLLSDICRYIVLISKCIYIYIFFFQISDTQHCRKE